MIFILASILLIPFSLRNYVNCECEECDAATTSSGIPLRDRSIILTVGCGGPVVMEDAEFLDEQFHTDHERIPERVVHAKGYGAKGLFEVTNDITKYSAAKLFSSIGKKTRVIVRFSNGFGDKGAADTAIDIRGFSIKFYTDEGNWDVLALNLRVFVVNEPKLFSSVAHSSKRHPTTNLPNATTLWDFLTLRPESSHAIMWLFSQSGFPCSMRGLNSFAINTFRLVNASGDYVFCKFNFVTNQKIRNLTFEQTMKLLSTDPDYYQRDMFYSIEKGNYPSWTLMIQVMTQQEADSETFDYLDVTKGWPEDRYPMIEVGRITLNENPANHFAEVEQIAFSPSNLVPGIRPSADKTLQARVFAYMDTQRYRIGNNFQQLPVNRPIDPVINNQRDGHMAFYNQGGAPNYFPNSFGGPEASCRAKNLSAPYYASGYVSECRKVDVDYFSQPKDFYENRLDDEGRKFLIESISFSLNQAFEAIQIRAIIMLSNINVDLARGITKKLLTMKCQPPALAFCGLEVCSP